MALIGGGVGVETIEAVGQDIQTPCGDTDTKGRSQTNNQHGLVYGSGSDPPRK